ncbi:MAG TPA: ATP-binding protein [Pyrinomonadaceae bacterium]|nr:ATP-binding protein [Pyrinomonadaceae bacterium]
MSDEAQSGGRRVAYSRPEGDGRTGGGAARGPERTAPGGRLGRALRAGGGALWPALLPLFVGFALLVGLVVGLGSVSIGLLEDISTETSGEERRLANVSNNLVNLRLSLNRLNTEARLRGRMEADAEGRRVQPPTAIPLRRERAEVEKLLTTFNALPLADPTRRQQLRDRAVAFVEATRDAETFSLNGFAIYRDLDRELEQLAEETSTERMRAELRRNDALAEARGRIGLLRWLAALTGLVVATATFLEVWRRFRQMRRANEALALERQFSAQMLGGMPSAVAALDREGRIRAANATFFEVFPGAGVGASVHDDFAGAEGRRLLAAAVGGPAAPGGGTSYRGRWPIADGDGRTVGGGGDGGGGGGGAGGRGPRDYDVYSSPLDLDGERGQLLTLVDVTEAAEAERELRRQESLAAVGKAAAQVAHEIKNPLGSIRLGVALLRDMIGGKEAATTIDLVERGINHLNKITLDVTQFSRRRQLSPVEVDLNALIDESLDLISDRIAERHVGVERRYADAPLEGRWDEDQLRQVFVNLVANAVDASPNGAPLVITTERTRLNPQKDHRADDKHVARTVEAVRVSFADRGSGMDEQTRSRIFEPFFTTKKKGTGLGLAIARQIVEQHGGAISVSSAPGSGTTFTIELPLTVGAG